MIESILWLCLCGKGRSIVFERQQPKLYMKKKNGTAKSFLKVCEFVKWCLPLTRSVQVMHMCLHGTWASISNEHRCIILTFTAHRLAKVHSYARIITRGSIFFIDKVDLSLSFSPPPLSIWVYVYMCVWKKKRSGRRTDCC